jgi:hypothetical protein
VKSLVNSLVESLRVKTALPSGAGDIPLKKTIVFRQAPYLITVKVMVAGMSATILTKIAVKQTN